VEVRWARMGPVMVTLRGRRAPRLARLLYLLLLVLAAPLVGCSSGGECDTCTSDDDCQTGFVCSTFSDGSRRCGSGVGASSCRVR
jgi:hypothetical protein